MNNVVVTNAVQMYRPGGLQAMRVVKGLYD